MRSSTSRPPGAGRSWRELRGGGRRVVLEDLLQDVATLAQVVQRQPIDLVVRAGEHAAVAVRLRGFAPLRLLHQPPLIPPPAWATVGGIARACRARRFSAR